MFLLFHVKHRRVYPLLDTLLFHLSLYFGGLYPSVLKKPPSSPYIWAFVCAHNILKLFDFKDVVQFISQVPAAIHLHCFQDLVIVNNAVMSRCVDLVFQFCASLSLPKCLMCILYLYNKSLIV